jgi:hypothetical protein
MDLLILDQMSGEPLRLAGRDLIDVEDPHRNKMEQAAPRSNGGTARPAAGKSEKQALRGFRMRRDR